MSKEVVVVVYPCPFLAPFLKKSLNVFLGLSYVKSLVKSTPVSSFCVRVLKMLVVLGRLDKTLPQPTTNQPTKTTMNAEKL
jgi:hypothetical protein